MNIRIAADMLQDIEMIPNFEFPELSLDSINSCCD